ncbi:type II toxin-antitoxin system RelB/DinJ family antitoxin [Nibricoccus sp. IMCC34717]|uniref:type II toxin-antitoxin system RelB/DinJ family antitoxin n=1 Tax=Nibricoccus sp. IMCC34717 TaxID=3034021 RepID=UPI0038512D4B
MASSTTLLRARVPKNRLRRAEKVLARMGLKTSDAVNLLFAQIELRGDLPFTVTTNPRPLLTPEEQGKVWNEALGEY